MSEALAEFDGCGESELFGNSCSVVPLLLMSQPRRGVIALRSIVVAWTISFFVGLVSPTVLPGQICLMDPDGSNFRKLPTLPVAVRSLSYSPSGSQITFSGLAADHMRVFVMTADGKNIRQIGDADTPDASSPTFTPDEKQLLVSQLNASGVGLYLMNLDGTGRKLFKDDALNAKYSADGSRVIFDRVLRFPKFGTELYVAVGDGSDERRVMTPGNPLAQSASFNPKNSAEIVLTTTTGDETAIWTQNVDGTQARALTPPHLLANVASYTPSGQQLVYSGEQLGSSAFALFKADLGAATSQPLSSRPAMSLLSPIFSPDGRTISFICSSAAL